jgi:hypothetical protein
MAFLLASKDSNQTFAKIHWSTEVNSESGQATESSQWHLKKKKTTMTTKKKEEE